VVAYVAGVTVLAGATAVIHTASVAVGSVAPARHDPVLDNQSAFSDVSPVDEVMKHVTQVLSPQPAPLTQPPVTQAQPILMSLFHIFSVTNTVASSKLFQVDHSSAISDSICARNHSSTSVRHFSRKDHVPAPRCNNRTSVKRHSTRQLPVAKKIRGMPADHDPLMLRSCHRRGMPADRDSVIPHQLSSLHPAAELGTSPPPASPTRISSSQLSDTYNSSLLLQLTAHVELV